MSFYKKLIILAVVVAVVCAAVALWVANRPPAAPAPIPAAASAGSIVDQATYIGREVCAKCHQPEDEAWRGSHHDLAMQEATPATVRGDFNNASFTYHDVTSTFFRTGDEFHVRTDGPDGKPTDYKIAYTFGIYPLQQYLIAFPGGRYQALNVCWDARPKGQGGQRWFHLYPNENVAHDDILHWTGPYQNWNHMCAECHSTNVHKNYEAAGDSYRTSWSELDVSCEACHGPGSAHVAWAHRNATSRSKSDRAGATMGLVALLHEEKPGIWLPDRATGVAKRDIPRTNHNEIEVCARCHSRRGTLNETVLPGRPSADTHRLALLEPTLYEADGQIKDEVYEYGSFIQSRMYAAGVTCSDCHNPHSLKTHAPGNMLCYRCHEMSRFDTTEHHYHAPGTKGSQCVECHMPTKNYMVVHARHDHSMRVPRPDLTISTGAPNACNGCHTDKTPQWAADEIARRTNGKPQRPSFGEALAAGRRSAPGADALLAKLLADPTQPAIARATAAQMLAGAENSIPLVAALGDASPLVRDAAVEALYAADTPQLAQWLGPLLTDPVRLVRIDAARRLAAVPDAQLPPEKQAARAKAMDEYLAAQNLDLDRAEARLNLGALHAERGEAEAAEKEYLAAIRINPRFPASYVNLGDLYRQLGREADALRVLQDGMAKATPSADVPHALGLALVRAGKLDEALPLLEQATKLAPDMTRYAYVYGVALESAGPRGRGIDVLKQAHERHPGDWEVLSALVAYCREAGRLDEAIEFAGGLAALRPNDPGARRLVEELKAQKAAAPSTSPKSQPGS